MIAQAIGTLSIVFKVGKICGDSSSNCRPTLQYIVETLILKNGRTASGHGGLAKSANIWQLYSTTLSGLPSLQIMSKT